MYIYSLYHRHIVNLLFTIRAADFNVRLPANTSPTKIFFLTMIGLMLPFIYIAGFGSLLMTVPAYSEAYVNGDAAGVLHKGGTLSKLFVITAGTLMNVMLIFISSV